MRMFKRSNKAESAGQAGEQADLSALVRQGEDMIEQLAQAHMSWGLGSADRWDLDQTTGVISWTFPDKTATAPAQILGSFSPGSGSWLWAWANKSILPDMSRDARSFRDWAEANGHAALAQPKVSADAQSASTLVALAVRVTGAAGYYKGPGSNSSVIITFGPVTLTNADGSTSSFSARQVHGPLVG
ncbi:DUF6882 domain-containing protein [Streptomyces griseorubiginosus]|uniref:DUF6882 domain-containing protein n=1 Tax=Streptomyces griseorubiginosus TaxID=67304 RepID=UPI002E81A29E|nr:DUF6882 domain-containing protein [Streptomyces griseorubiginosus]WUB42049.1 hypothetical protein OHN19_01405 [Streptomyces griseorubiginosus]WUB50568.1 hypothetical protein OG942_01400 [Streptomyces griseorubiginosus]